MTKRKTKTTSAWLDEKSGVDSDVALLGMRVDSMEHQGVAAVTFLGRTWVDRGPKYWLKRFLATLLYLCCFAFVGAMSYGFGTGIVGDGKSAIRIVVVVVWSLTVVPGFIVGVRLARHSGTGFPGKK